MITQSFFIYTVMIFVLAAGALTLTWLLGGRHQARARNEIFESGLIPTGGSRIRFPIKFYQIALFFLIFDLEVAFVMLWAYVYKAAGWSGFAHISIFIALLFAALLYPWLKGGLDFVSKPGKQVSP